MQANEKRSKNLLIINNRTEHVLEEHKHAQTKTIKQQKTDSNLQPQKNGNHELETTASRQNAKQQNRYIEDGSQLKTNEKSETNTISNLELASERSQKRYKEATYTTNHQNWKRQSNHSTTHQATWLKTITI